MISTSEPVTMYSDCCLVLLVEDHSDLREVTADLLETANFKVVQAANGQRALEKLQELDTVPEAIVLDLMMPMMNGWEFLQILQSDPNLANIPVVVLSALSTDWPDKGNVVELLHKPASFAHITAALKKACTAPHSTDLPD